MNPKVAIHSSLSKTRSAILIRTRKINRKISKHVPTGVQVILHHLVLVAICVSILKLIEHVAHFYLSHAATEVTLGFYRQPRFSAHL
jgi:cellobiose-specific phosphotransferase system component IIC